MKKDNLLLPLSYDAVKHDVPAKAFRNTKEAVLPSVAHLVIARKMLKAGELAVRPATFKT